MLDQIQVKYFSLIKCFHFSNSPNLLDLKEIEKKLREAKAEREKLLKERVSRLPGVGNRMVSLISQDTLL